jgi:tetratricopeptide (TPR) repeat protein
MARCDRSVAQAEISLAMLNKTAARRKLTRREQRDLDIEISFMEGVVRRDPDCFDAWRVLSDDYSRRRKFEKCLQADEELARMAPDNPAVLYDLACGYSLNKRVEQSLAALSCAVARGFKDFRLLLRDPDLVNLRRDPTFKKVWEKISAAKSGAV